MSVDTNVVVLVGRLTRDPELRALPSGISVCEIRLGVNTLKKTPGGEYEDKGNFFSVVAFGKAAESIVKNCHRGDRVAVTGRLETEEWEDKEGGRRERTKIVAVGWPQFLTPKGEKREGEGFTVKNDEEEIPF